MSEDKPWQFQKGNRLQGSRKGVPNKTTRILKDALILAAEACGDLSGIYREDLSEMGIEHGEQGLVGYLKWVAKVHPKSFISILAKLLPIQHRVDSFSETVYRSVEELQHEVSQRGLNLRAFGKLLLEAHPVKSNNDSSDDGAGGASIS